MVINLDLVPMATFIPAMAVSVHVASPLVAAAKNNNIRRGGSDEDCAATATVHVANTSGYYCYQSRA
jgi:hypothetical protein